MTLFAVVLFLGSVGALGLVSHVLAWYCLRGLGKEKE
jgi:hypothetical protein